MLTDVIIPNTLADYLGISPQKIYAEISNWSLYRLRKVLLVMMVNQAAEEITKVKKKVLQLTQEQILQWQWMIV